MCLRKKGEGREEELVSKRNSSRRTSNRKEPKRNSPLQMLTPPETLPTLRYHALVDPSVPSLLAPHNLRIDRNVPSSAPLVEMRNRNRSGDLALARLDQPRLPLSPSARALVVHRRRRVALVASLRSDESVGGDGVHGLRRRRRVEVGWERGSVRVRRLRLRTVVVLSRGGRRRTVVRGGDRFSFRPRRT